MKERKSFANTNTKFQKRTRNHPRYLRSWRLKQSPKDSPRSPQFQGTLFLNGYSKTKPDREKKKREILKKKKKKMGIQTDDSYSSSSSSPAAGKSIIVVMDASRDKGSLDALDWAIEYIVRPKDTVVVLGVLPELGKKTAPTCFPFHMGIGLTSGISLSGVKLELSAPGEMSPSELQDEIETKKEEFQIVLQPFYRQCKKSKVKLEFKLAVGYDPWKITVEEAQKFNPRWIVLDSYLKKDKELILEHVACTVAVMKRKGVATLTPSKIRGLECEQMREVCKKIDDKHYTAFDFGNEDELNNTPHNIKPCSKKPAPQSPCWYPLSWRTGFPKAFPIFELGVMTNSFSDEHILLVKGERKVYAGIYHETPVLIMSYPGKDHQACSILKIVSRVRHRSILNLVGYCFTDDAMFLLYDYPGTGTLEMNLQCDESAKNMSWKARWYAAMEIGAGLRYLHEDCADGPIVDLSLCSANVVFSHGSSPMLSMYHTTMKWLKFDRCSEEESPTKSNDWDDVQCYGIILIELISGKSEHHLEETWEGRSLTDWALPLLEKGLLNQVMDPRLKDTGEAGVGHMVRAALLCLKNDSSQKLTISQVLAVVRGDMYVMTNY